MALLVIMPSQLVVPHAVEQKEQSRPASLPFPTPSSWSWPTHVCVSVAAAETQLAHKTKFQNNLRLAIFEDALRNFIEMFGSFSCRAQFVSHTHTHTSEADYTACNFDFCIAYFLGHVKQTFRLLWHKLCHMCDKHVYTG